MNIRSLVHKIWYFLWFGVLPLLLAWFTVDVLDRMRVVDEFEPWYVLLLFALLVILIYSARDHLPFWQDRDENSPANRSRRLRTGKSLARRLKKLIKKYQKRLSTTARKDLDAALNDLEAAIEDKKDGEINAIANRIEKHIEKYMPFSKRSLFWEYFESIGAAVLIALLLRLFAMEAFKIPSESMVPTLMVGDHIFVNKYHYGLSIPFQNKRIIRFYEPAYGDVIVFAKPSLAEQGLPLTAYYADAIDPNDMAGEDFIKRIIALPGDKVEIRESVVYVNDRPIPRCPAGRALFKSRDYLTADTWMDEELDLWIERHGAHTYTVVEEPFLDNYPAEVVPEGHVFVLGDNRDHSSDSRYWGTVPIDNIKGRASVIWWSNKRPHGFAWDRVGMRIMGSPHLTPAQQRIFDACQSPP
ncbi:MAG: signal peptidase I [Proteobacteria bacterium]|nr:signal peptidase I [Pseudomonadota bacterium]